MALRAGNISQTTKTSKKKLEKIKNSNINLDIKKIDDNKIKVVIEIDSIIEPYVRNRMSGMFNKNENSKTRSVHLYDPLNSYKKYIQKVLREQIKNKYPDYQLCKGEIKFKITVWTKPPKSFTKRQLVWSIIKKIFRPLTKPDIDNVAKTAMDVCSKILWEDDNQVVTLIVEKYYGESNRTLIESEMSIKSMEIKGRATKEEEELWKTIKI
jgi:Holliday junction resolvase RusA-like endonuclease